MTVVTSSTSYAVPNSIADVTIPTGVEQIS